MLSRSGPDEVALGLTPDTKQATLNSWTKKSIIKTIIPAHPIIPAPKVFILTSYNIKNNNTFCFGCGGNIHIYSTPPLRIFFLRGSKLMDGWAAMGTDVLSVSLVGPAVAYNVSHFSMHSAVFITRGGLPAFMLKFCPHRIQPLF